MRIEGQESSLTGSTYVCAAAITYYYLLRCGIRVWPRPWAGWVQTSMTGAAWAASGAMGKWGLHQHAYGGPCPAVSGNTMTQLDVPTGLRLVTGLTESMPKTSPVGLARGKAHSLRTSYRMNGRCSHEPSRPSLRLSGRISRTLMGMLQDLLLSPESLS